MTTMDDYISSVLNNMPRATPQRDQIAAELRGHISERLAHGHPLDEVLGKLGDPVRLAESYLSAVPLVSAPLGHRALAKTIDVVLAVVVIIPVGWLILRLLEVPLQMAIPIVLLAAIAGGSFLFAVYTIVAEHVSGQTPGKRLLGIRVVRESGARIGLGQSIVRQLPMFLQVFWIDVMFSLFTDKHQRAFEMLSKTRTVLASAGD